MSTNALTKKTNVLPSFVNDFFKPWNDWFDNGFEKTLSIPAVNITENNGQYNVSVAAPGMKKDDFKIGLEGDLLTISAEKEESKEEKDKDKQYNRREYNYSSFSRSFTLPEEVKRDKIEAKYEDGVLKLVLPKSETAKVSAKSITVK
jgi:HSP20 family protein